MIEGPASCFIARNCARSFGEFPLDRHDLDRAERSLQTFTAVGLLSEEEADAWRRWLSILATEPAELPLAPEGVRVAARAHAAELEREWHHEDDEGDARDRSSVSPGEEENIRRWDALVALQRVGALTWRDVEDDPADTSRFVIERVIAAPPQPANDIVLSTVARYEHGLDLEWYVARSIASEVFAPYGSDAPGGPAELELSDDLGTTYRAVSWRNSLGEGDNPPSTGATFFEPAPRSGATSLAVARRGVELVRIPLV